MGILSASVIEKLGIPPDTELAPETDLLSLGVTQAQIIALLDTSFPMMLGMEHHNQQQRAASFEYGLTATEQQLSTIELLDQQSSERVSFGQAGTAGRLSALIEFCSQKAYPDNGGD